MRLHLHGQKSFLEFARPAFFIRQKKVFDILLGDRAGALVEIHIFEIDHGRTGNSNQIEAGMPVEILIFGIKQGIDEIRADLIQRDPFAGAVVDRNIEGLAIVIDHL